MWFDGFGHEYLQWVTVIINICILVVIICIVFRLFKKAMKGQEYRTLYNLTKAGVISEEEAYQQASNKKDYIKWKKSKAEK